MDWYKIGFPENVFPFDSSDIFDKEVREIYESNGYPKDFAVYIDHGNSGIYYFNPTACTSCAEFFKSYRGSFCDNPAFSGKTITKVVP